MFFSIDTQIKSNFPNHLKIGNFYVSFDNGWRCQETGSSVILYKGYLDEYSIDDTVFDIILSNRPKYLGNFCVINFDKMLETVKIHSDLYRSFPIYFQEGSLSNLEKLSSTAWADSLLEIDKNFKVRETKFDLIGTVDTDIIPENEVLDQIDQILQKKTKQFLLHNTLPIKAFLSGGVDTMLVYSYLQKFTENFEMIKCSHVDHDYFWMHNSGDLKQLWGYTQIHHWSDPCVLTSGAPGDEFTLRNPTQVCRFLKYHGLSLTEMLNGVGYQNCLHHRYFLLSKHLQKYQNLPVETSLHRQQFFWTLCNEVVNDWQHWHLGNTLTWTPLRDLAIFRLLLRLPINSAISQALDSSVSIQLIERNNKDLKKLLSPHKNTGNVLSNLCDFLIK